MGPDHRRQVRGRGRPERSLGRLSERKIRLKAFAATGTTDAMAAANSALLPPQPDHLVDAGDLIAFRRGRRLAEQYVGRRDVQEVVLVFNEEVMVLGIIGVEIGF